jgi:antitoxin component YwqK of YwqJK toxin-antitoxin module
MKIIVIILLIATRFNITFCQETAYNKTYFDSLIVNVTSDRNIKENHLVINRFFNGKIKNKKLQVKYNDDNENRYWQLGKSFSYYKNGRIKGWNNVDLNKRILIDTAYYFNRKGNIKLVTIWINDSNYTQVPLYAPFLKIWINYPVKYRQMTFNNGRLFYDRTYVNNNGMFDLDGEAIFYKKDGTIDEKFKYIKGKRIK